MEVHTNNLWFYCDVIICLIVGLFICLFKKSYSFTNYIAQENGCDFSARTRTTVDKHMRKVHEGNTQLYECHVCMHRVVSTRSLKSHLNTVHKILPTAGNGRFR